MTLDEAPPDARARGSGAAPCTSDDLASARAEASRLLKAGEPILALDIIDAGIAHWPQDLQLQQLRALGLARSGALERSVAILRALAEEGHRDGETLGLLGGRLKELAQQCPDGQERERLRAEALRVYDEAYRNATRRRASAATYFAGINVASLAWLSGDHPRARRMADAIARICSERLLHAPAEERYWLHATLGEAALLRGELESARGAYGEAAALARAAGRFADLASTRRQAQLLLAHGACDEAVLARLELPSVVAFTGHMIDHPERSSPRLPVESEAHVRGELLRQLSAMDAGFGYASAACGGDLLFLEAMLARSAEIQVVLPFPAAEFRRSSVDFAGPRWIARFTSVLERATAVHVLSPSAATDPTAAYEYANLSILGMAQLRAERLGAALRGLAVWDRQPGARGGAGDVVEHWRRRGLAVEIVDPAASCGPAAGEAARPAAPERACAQRLMAMLFADAVGYSKLRESQIPLFVHHFLGAVAAVVDAARHPPESKNTWGDALYFVFSTVDAAAHFALDLRDRLTGTDWTARGLPEGLSLRIALHAGPVYPLDDPVTGAPGYSGAHVSRAARIEPVTPPGEVFASEPFAAVAAATGVAGVSFDYVGQTRFAKAYGVFPVYHVRRRLRADREPRTRSRRCEAI